MGANIAGIYGAQILRSEDKPKYRRGFTVAIGVLAAGVVLAIIRYIDDRIRRIRTGRDPQVLDVDEEEYRDEKTVTVTATEERPHSVLVGGEKPSVSSRA